MTMKFKETPGDRAVKDRLWDATKREVMGFAERYAAGHVVGARATQAQDDIAAAAKAKGYRKGMVRDLGSLIRRGEQGGGRRYPRQFPVGARALR